MDSPDGPATAYFQAYEDLRDGNCSSALEKANPLVTDRDQGHLVAAAAKACLAAFNNEDKYWPEAKAARDAVTNLKHCLDAAVFALLDRFVSAYEEHPDWEFQKTGSGGAEGTPPCPSITQLTPNHGDAGQVTINGVNLQRVTKVIVRGPNGDGDELVRREGEELVRREGDDTALQILMPDPQGFTQVCVVIVAESEEDWGDWVTDGAVFTYDPPAGSAESDAPAPSTPNDLACP
ncbi:MAG: hypothetical protein ACT4NY_11475 [Pseudonocardiales bacterium]